MLILRKIKLVAVATLLFVSYESIAQLSMPALFSDNMVLQQKTNAPVWGRATPGVAVIVEFADKFYSTIADVNGKWQVTVKTGAHGGPYTLTVSNGKEKLEYKNILLGEVWVCSGQSNMEMPLEGWPNPNGTFRFPINHAEHQIYFANYPSIRLLQLKPAWAASMKDDISLVGKGWNECTSQSVRTFPAVAYFFAKEVYERTKIPVGLIASSVGGSTAELWTSLPVLKTIDDFKQQVETIEADTAKNKRVRFSAFFNGMIAPLIPYAIKGVLWYQGEFSADRAFQYKELFPKMIKDWRARWQQGDFPFYYVQLPILERIDTINMKSDWAELREAQLQTLSLSNTAMAVTIDFTDNDLHPANKQDVGLRLAWIALARNYGFKIPYSGPLYKEHRLEGDTVRIIFSNPEVGLKTRNGDELRGFYIAGPDSVFYRAIAKIDGNTILVSSNQVSTPISVRYQWGYNPPGNLFSNWLLPASPFRTDNWKMITDKRK